MPAPAVTVIIGTYNKARYIADTIQSVLDQTFADFELIVVDDVSTDRTAEIIRRFEDPRIRLIPRTENSGRPAVPRNQAVAAARGEKIAFLDADDLWDKTKLERQVRFMEEHPDIPMMHCSCRVIDENGSTLHTRHAGSIPATGHIFEALLKHCYITTSMVMLRKSLYEQMGGMLEGHEWRTGEDYEFFLRIAAAHQIGFLDQVLGSYRSQPADESISQEGTNWRGIPEHVPTLQHLLNHPSFWESITTRTMIVDGFVTACLENAWYWRDRGQAKRARWFLIRAIRLKPGAWALWKCYFGSYRI